MSSRRTISLTIILGIATLACSWVGLGYMTGGIWMAGSRALVVLVIVPCILYFVLGPPLFGAALSVLWPQRKTPRFGYCPKCGYDLRATPHRCPECGAVPKA